MKWALLAVFLSGCAVSDSKSLETLSGFGLQDAGLGGFAPFSCGDDYSLSRQFEAVARDGHKVKGVVCCGWIKACTVKF